MIKNVDKLSRKNLIIVFSILITLVVVLSAGIGVVIVAIASTINSSITIGYSAKYIDAAVTARYWTSGNNWNWLGSEQGLVFDSNTSNGSEMTLSPNEEIIMENDDRKIVFEYTFTNTSDSIYLNLDLIQYPSDTTNMNVGYYISDIQLNDVSNLLPLYTIDEWHSETLIPVETKDAFTCIYIIAEVQEGARSADFDGSFEWALEVPNEYAVIFDMDSVKNYSDFSGNLIAMEGVPFENLPVAECVNEGYAFCGWFEDREFQAEFCNRDYVTSNMTLYPRFLQGNIGVESMSYNEETDNYEVTDLSNFITTANSITAISNQRVGNLDNVPDGALIIPDTIEIEGTVYPVTNITTTITNFEAISELYIGNNVEYIPNEFMGITRQQAGSVFNTSLKKLYLGKSLKHTGNYSFQNCQMLTDLNIPSSISQIGVRCFGGCKNLTNVTIENGVKIIGITAFLGCEKIKEIYIPDSVTNLYNQSFNGSGLIKIRLSNNLETIETAFYNCRQLVSITIPKSVKMMSNPFYYCKALTSVRFEETEGWVLSTTNNAADGEPLDVIQFRNNGNVLWKVPYDGYFIQTKLN
ncbi:MAG: leucine-rich repeat domain-containing protein [Clostridia bacterium]|nr:leucine-rich repeat domain-containing protein [Clostridia bacterium]